ncbi:MAG: alpha/beta fold hydrolase [Calothrix sp. MO_167.B42]|nr:alpha/beta fold hydrolase [Calothrix sp. MO_167.B42]
MEENTLRLSMGFPLKMLMGLGIATTITYLAVCIFLFFHQTRFLFFPSQNIETTPKSFYIDYEDVWLPIKVGTNKVEYVHGWWMPAKGPKAKVLLYLHGNALNVGANVGHAHRFHQLGFSVLLIDYRGYGRSQGSFPNEVQVYEDAAVAWKYLVQQRGIAPSQIVIYGHSLGGAVAIDLAVKYPGSAGLIVESSFTSVRDVIFYRNSFGMFPVELILTQRFESITKVPRLQVPVLFIHGTADTTVPSFMSQNLYNAAPESKQLLLVPGAGHNNAAEVAPSQYIRTVKSFFQKFSDSQLSNMPEIGS